MQQLKADLKYCQQVKSAKVTKRIKGNTSTKTASKKDRRFIEALEQSLLAPRTLLKAVVNEQNNVSRVVVTESQKIVRSKSQVKQTDNTIESKNGSVKQSDSSTSRTVQNKVNTLTGAYRINAQASVTSKNEKLASNIAGSEISGIEKFDLQGISDSDTSKSELKAADFMIGKYISQIENPTSKTAQKDHHQKQDTKPSFIKTSLTSDITDSSMENNHKSGEIVKEPIKYSANLKTPASKINLSDNSISIEKTGVMKFNAAETTGSNLEKATLSKSQIDLIVSKMIQQIKIAPCSLEVSLKPEYLGKVNILLQSKDGLISVNFIAQNGEAMDLLNSNLKGIKDNLDQQGIKLQQMDVSLANQEKQDNQAGSRYRDGTRQRQSLVEIPQKHGYIESSEQISLLPYKLNLLA